MTQNLTTNYKRLDLNFDVPTLKVPQFTIGKSDYFYTKSYIDRKFCCNTPFDLNKSAICDKIESKTGNETRYITITDAEDDHINVEYSYYDYGESETDTITLYYSDFLI